MKKIISLTLFGSFLSLTLAACGEIAPGSPQLTTPSPPSASATPLQCVTATPQPAQIQTAGSLTAVAAGRTTPSAIQPTLSPQELATREAELEKHNRPVTLPAGTPIALSLPVCPTPTPAK